MSNVAVPVWLFYTLLFVIIILIGGMVWVWLYFKRKDNTDKVIMLDKDMRWSFLNVGKLGKKNEFDIDKKQYFCKENMGMLNNKGKVLYIFNENNPQPMKIEKHIGKWLDPQSLKGVINNKLVQLMLKPADKFTDTILLIGAIGGMIAGISSGIILLIQLGVI